MPDPNPAPQNPAANPADPSAIANPAQSANPNPAPPEVTRVVAPPSDSGAWWPDGWQEKVFGTDDKARAWANRFTSLPEALKSGFEANKTLRSNVTKNDLPDNPTPEQLTAYRAERGIPEKPEGYLEKIPNGLVIGENDKPIFESFMARLHKHNADPKLAHEAIAWYNDFQEEQAAKTSEADTGHRTETEDALRAEWGADYRANVNHVKTFLESAPEGIGDRIANARDGEGRALLNDPKVLRWLASTARELNPISTIVPGTAGNQAETVDTEIATIEKFMRTNRKEYNGDSKMQERLRNLYDARERIRTRAA